jgi:hypothetical protein
MVGTLVAIHSATARSTRDQNRKWGVVAPKGWNAAVRATSPRRVHTLSNLFLLHFIEKQGVRYG